MKICVVGFGQVGAQLCSLWKQAGHDLTIGLRAGSEREAAAKRAGMQVLPPKDAIQVAQVVALAVPWAAVETILPSIHFVPRTIVVDATNPLTASLGVLVPPAGSGARQVAQWAVGARVVKAFNTIGAACLGNSRFDSFYCGDDEEANLTVRALIADTGMHPVDVGSLEAAGYLEQLAGLWIDLAMRGKMQVPFGFNLVGGDAE